MFKEVAESGPPPPPTPDEGGGPSPQPQPQSQHQLQPLHQLQPQPQPQSQSQSQSQPQPEPEPQPQPRLSAAAAMAFTIDLDEGKVIDTHKYENLMKKSMARHQRVHSMSASWQRSASGTSAPAPTPTPTSAALQRPPLSGKLPRRAHGYHSEGYFSSDQEEAPKFKRKSPGCGCERDSLRLRQHNPDSPLAEKRSPFDKSPETAFNFAIKKSKSPIVDSIMSRSDTLPSRQALNLPLKHPHTASLARVVPELTPSPNGTTALHNYPLRSPYFQDQNLADVPMIADTSSPELDLLTPDNVMLTPGTPSRLSLRRNSSGVLGNFSPGPKNKTSPAARDAKSPNVARNDKVAIENDGNVSPSSTVSEAGTYTIEADNYTEEQKAKMNIDEAFCVDDFNEPIRQALDIIHQAETPSPDTEKTTLRDIVITKEPRSNNFVSNIREELLLAKTIPDPIRKVSTDKNVLEISCCYESPTESNEPLQANKPVKSAKNYLDKIKSRMKNISEKTFQKSPKTPDASFDVGSFTSVTASGVLGSLKQKSSKLDDSYTKAKFNRKNSLTKSQIDSSEYVHHIQRDNLVLQNVTNDSFTPTPEENALECVDNLYENEDHILKVTSKTPEQILVGKLSHLSLNRCQGDKSWIQEWADSVKKHNKETAVGPTDVGLPPISPRHSVLLKGKIYFLKYIPYIYR